MKVKQGDLAVWGTIGLLVVAALTMLDANEDRDAERQIAIATNRIHIEHILERLNCPEQQEDD